MISTQTKWQGHPIFDVESQIVKTGNCHSPCDLGPFQEALDRIAGKDISGRSLLKIEWGQDPKVWKWVCGHRRLKYPFWRNIVRHEGFNPKTGIWGVWEELFEIGVPRFFISELHSMGELKKDGSWDRARYQWDGGTCMDVLGPIPEDGFYTALFTVAYHDQYCCNGREFKKDAPCFGSFRIPGEADLERVRKAKWNRDHAPNDVLAPSAELLMKRQIDQMEAREERWTRETEEAIDDFFKTHGHTFANHSDKLQRHGKYQFTRGSSKSGLTQEERIELFRKTNNVTTSLPDSGITESTRTN